MVAGVQTSSRDGAEILRVRGDLNVHSAQELWRALERARRRRSTKRVTVDFSEVGTVDSSGVVVVALGMQRLSEVAKRLEVRALTDRHRAAFRMIPAAPEEAAGGGPGPSSRGFVEGLGARVAALSASARGFGALLVAVARAGGRCLLRRDRMLRGSVVEQAVRMGVDALALSMALSFLLGLILAFQSLFQLRQFGAEVFMADIVGVGMVREFGPMLTAIILAGRSSTGIAAEIGTMAVREEIDALRALGVDPNRFLVLPRILGLLIAQPILTIFAMVMGCLGGISLAKMAGLSIFAFSERMSNAITVGDVGNGLIKSFLFAVIVGMSGSYMGMTVKGGATNVGRSTTTAVVAAIALIVVLDSAVTALSVWVSNV